MSQTVLRAATHGAGKFNLMRGLAHFLPFKTSGALRGDLRPSSTGALNVHEKELLFEDWNDIAFIVYSYATPIAWVTKDGREHIVDQRFSVTTSKHQGTLYALGRTDLF